MQLQNFSALRLCFLQKENKNTEIILRKIFAMVIQENANGDVISVYIQTKC